MFISIVVNVDCLLSSVTLFSHQCVGVYSVSMAHSISCLSSGVLCLLLPPAPQDCSADPQLGPESRGRVEACCSSSTGSKRPGDDMTVMHV